MTDGTSGASGTSGTAAVSFERAAFAYAGGPVVLDVDTRIETGAMVGLVGPSGAGKTTMLRAVLGQLRPVRGRVVTTPGLRVGYVPQLETIDWNFPITVGQAVLLGRVSESGPWPWPRKHDRDEAAELLDRLGIGELWGRQIRALSGGQQQRVFLARALIRRPDVLVLDEPTAGVDVATRRELLVLLEKVNRDGITVIVATHDLNSVAAMLPWLVCLNRRVVAAGPPEHVLSAAVLRATFGAEMVVVRHEGQLLATDAPLHDAVDRAHAHHVHLHDGPAHEPLSIVVERVIR